MMAERYSLIRLTRRSWRVVLIGCLALVPACKPTPAAVVPVTAVGQGELYETGNIVYDEYFATVHELHAAVVTGELEERDARTTLATMLHLLPTAPAEQVLRKLRDRSGELPPAEMEVKAGKEGESSKAEVKVLRGGPPQDAAKNLLLVMEATANADLDLGRRMAEIPERARRMHSLAKNLIDGIERDFSGESPAKRAQVRQELEASLDVLVIVANGARGVEERVRSFVVGLQEVLQATEDNEPASEGPGAQAPKPAPKMPEDFNP